MKASAVANTDDFWNAVESLDLLKLKDVLYRSDGVNIKDFPEVLHVLIEALLNHSDRAKEAAQLVYLLALHGADVNSQDDAGNTAVLNYLQNAEEVSNDVVTAFFRSGSDSFIKNVDGEDVLNYILQSDRLPKYVREKVLEYMPGIWQAVDSDDAGTVRRLVNQWCHVHTIKHGISVQELAYLRGTENIIRVISGISQSMNIAHGVLAEDILLVECVLQSNSKVNINLRNMSEWGATPLFYAMCLNNRVLVDLLIGHGARLDIGMFEDKDQTEMPLYIALLAHWPPIDVQMLRHTIPMKPVPVDQLYYKGQNVIFCCINYNVDAELLEEILRRCSAHVLTQRIKDNLDARLYAMRAEKFEFVNIIDKVVTDWCMDDVQVANRNQLCLHGYQLPITAGDSTNVGYIEFHSLIQEFQMFTKSICEAVEAGDGTRLREMLNDTYWSQKGLDVCLADCRSYGIGQPLLHKAVLRQHTEVVQVLAEHIVHRFHQKLDSIKDQMFRTVLHYAYGMKDAQTLINLLEEFGMSEHVMDKDGRSPLAFKDRKSLPEMMDLLNYQLLQDFTHPEPEPWNVKLPLPITGFISRCLHQAHSHNPKQFLHSRGTSCRIVPALNEPECQQLYGHKSGCVSMDTYFNKESVYRNHVEVVRHYQTGNVYDKNGYVVNANTPSEYAEQFLKLQNINTKMEMSKSDSYDEYPSLSTLGLVKRNSTQTTQRENYQSVEVDKSHFTSQINDLNKCSNWNQLGVPSDNKQDTSLQAKYCVIV